MTCARLPEMICNVTEMAALAAEISLRMAPGMAVLLEGDLGAGKSTFARAFIRALAPRGAEFDIPSPTFTLVQTYTETRIPVAHADLYRTNSASELGELGLDELIQDHVVVVEWPERLDASHWPDTLEIEITGRGDSRHVKLMAKGRCATGLARNLLIKAFLANTKWKSAAREFLEGDASFRRYEALRGETPVILMDMPARADGPPVKHGKPYSAVAHLAEDIRAVAAINGKLVAAGYSAPVVHALDTSSGLAIIEDLGREVFATRIRAGVDMREPMRVAVEVLADIARQDWPVEAPVGDGQMHIVPPYDEDAQLIEVDLLPSWFWPYRHGVEVPADLREEFADIWKKLLPFTREPKPVWTLRDYHSPNLLWLPERSGLRRIGIIDSQDCVRGHPAYDLASMLQDARVDIDFSWADELLEHYCSLRQRLDRADFEAAYALLGAQRATKILGIFARLSKRDGKHAYLAHLPRVSRCLERNLQHPMLAPLKRWYDKHLPAELREARR